MRVNGCCCQRFLVFFLLISPWHSVIIIVTDDVVGETWVEFKTHQKRFSSVWTSSLVSYLWQVFSDWSETCTVNKHLTKKTKTKLNFNFFDTNMNQTNSTNYAKHTGRRHCWYSCMQVVVIINQSSFRQRDRKCDMWQSH